MSLLSYGELCELVVQGVITDVNKSSINGTSIDVHLGSKILIEDYCDSRLGIVDIYNRKSFKSTEVNISTQPYDLAPNEFVLAHTIEKFNLPSNISAEFRLKSSGARSGMNNLFACHCDPQWNGSVLTLELHNVLRFNRSRLTMGMPIGQMIFHKVVPVPSEQGYAARGRYNNDKHVSAVKA